MQVERSKGRTTDLIASIESCAKRAELGKKIGYNINAMASHAPLQKQWAELWTEIKHDVDLVLRQASLNIDFFAESFKSLGLTADPRVFFRFAPANDSMWMNIWGAMYHPPFEIASTLVHENEHRTFCVEKGVIGASHDELVNFGKQHGKDSEIKAHQMELDFLKKVRNSIDRTWIVILPTSVEINYDVDKQISEKEQRLAELNTASVTPNADEYQVASTSKARSDLLKIMQSLRVNLIGLDQILRNQPEPIFWWTGF